jgi:CheY-like chemotaxis protein
MPKAPQKPPKKDNGTSPGDQIKLVLDSIRALVTIGFGVVGIAFLWWNWTELTSLISNLNRVEFAGVKAEFGNKTFIDYKSQLRGQGEVDKGFLEQDQFYSVQYRGLWLQPVLASSRLLWVDDTPEFNNVEMQLLSTFRINISVARSNDQAIDELKKRPFDLVISDISRPDEPPGKTPLSECPVRWFEVPESIERREQAKLNKPLSADQKRDLLETWNRQSNAEPYAGFALMERMHKELPADKIAPVILYSNFTQSIGAKCSRTITADAYVLYQSVFEHLERARWRVFGKYTPPWLKEFVEKSTKPELKAADAAEKK